MDDFKLVDSFYNNIYDILDDFDFVRGGKKGKVANVPMVFDIETSSFYINNEKCACMYAWVFGINGKCVRGRTWEDFDNLLKVLIKEYKLTLNKRIIIYVHNLSYEFQFIKHRFEWEKVFSVDQRKPLYAITKDGIEFRCSYLLSGYNLASLGKNLLTYKIEKMVGDLDYKLIRHSKTPLSDKEWKYILNDGLVVMAHIQEEINRVGKITKLPLTKTGYVRELCRDNCFKGNARYEYSRLMKWLTMSVEDYHTLQKAFMGGFTHANHNYVGKVVKDVTSYDETSAYPSVMLSEKFPMSPPKEVNVETYDDFEKYLEKYCCLFEISFHNLRPKIDFEHYISKSKCGKIEGYIIDNGRVVCADYVEMVLTEQDYFIISNCYEWDKIELGKFKIYYKDYLPKDLILTILDLYEQKTTLKGVDGEEVNYMLAKGMLNSCYGMCVTDPCKDEQVFENATDWHTIKADTPTLIEMYNESKTRFLYYPWGIWVTAYARKNLWSAILELKDDYIYSDTDSVKFINVENHLEYFETYNNMVGNKIKECLTYHDIPYSKALPKTIKGVVKPLGVWDYEGKYTFKTLGAKRYMYVDENNELHITISGVNKKTGVNYLKSKYKTTTNIFKAFNEGLEFPSSYYDNGEELNASGKLCHTYIDVYKCDYVIDYLGNKDIFCEYSACHMEPTSYLMSLDAYFIEYLFGNANMFTRR